MQLEEGLIRKRQEIVQIEGAIGKAKRDLIGLADVLRLHDVQIDPNEIAPTLPQARRRMLPYGVMTRRIYAALRAHGDWMRTPDLVLAVAATNSEELPHEVYCALRDRVRRRMFNLFREGTIEKMFGPADGTDNAYTQWRLKS